MTEVQTRNGGSDQQCKILKIVWQTCYSGHKLSAIGQKWLKTDKIVRKAVKWPDKSTTSYAMLDFESDIENL